MLRKSATNTAAEKTGPTVYHCSAKGCMMAGTILPGGSSGCVCVYHYESPPHDWPRITRILSDWDCVTDEIEAARRSLTNPKTSMDLRFQNRQFAAAWARLSEAAPGWVSQLQPGNGRTGHAETYRDWAARLERFLNVQLTPKRPA